MMRTLACALVLGCVLGCAGRAALPLPRRPFTPTADDAVRARAPDPLPGAPPRAELHAHERVLANGLRVVVVERPGTALATVVYVNRKAPPKPPRYPADIAMLTMDVVRHGYVRPDGSAVSGLRVAGRPLFGYVSTLHTAIGVSVERNATRAALHAIARCVQAPRLDASALESAKQAQGDMLYESSRTPRGLVAPLVAALAFGNEHRWALDNVAWARELATAELADLRRFYAAAYRPEHSSLVVVGDVDPHAVLAWAEAELGAWQPPQRGVATSPSTANRARGEERAIYAVFDGGTTTRISIVHPIPGANHPDVHTLGVLRHVLAGGMSSQLSNTLRHEAGTTYGLQGGLHPHADGGYLEIVVRVPNHATADTVKQIFERLDAASSASIGDEELNAAKAGYLAELVPMSNEGLALRLAELESLEQPPSSLDAAAHAVADLSAAELRAAAASHLAASRASVLTLGDFAWYERALSRLGRLRLMQMTSHSEAATR